MANLLYTAMGQEILEKAAGGDRADLPDGSETWEWAKGSDLRPGDVVRARRTTRFGNTTRMGFEPRALTRATSSHGHLLFEGGERFVIPEDFYERRVGPPAEKPEPTPAWEWVKGSELRPGDVVRAVDPNARCVTKTRALLKNGPLCVGERRSDVFANFGIVGHDGLCFAHDAFYERRVTDPMQGKRWRFEITASGWLKFMVSREEYNATLELWPTARRELGFQIILTDSGCWCADWCTSIGGPNIPTETQHARTRQVEAWLADRVEAESGCVVTNCTFISTGGEYTSMQGHIDDVATERTAMAEPDNHCSKCGGDVTDRPHVRTGDSVFCAKCCGERVKRVRSAGFYLPPLPLPKIRSPYGQTYAGIGEPAEVALHKAVVDEVLNARLEPPIRGAEVMIDAPVSADVEREQAQLQALKNEYLDHIDATWQNPPPRAGWLDSQLIAMIQRDWPERYQEVYKHGCDPELSRPKCGKAPWDRKPPLTRTKVTGTCGLRMGR